MYITIIQMCLLLQFSLVCFCELTPFFAHTAKSIIVRCMLGLSLITVVYYSNLLVYADYPLILSMFTLAIVSTALSFKYVITESWNRFILRNEHEA